jgi:uncharacterized protein YciI
MRKLAASKPCLSPPQTQRVSVASLYYARLHEQGKLLYGGPFIDADSGGMMIAADDVTREELEAFAASDPAVLTGLLTFELETWYVTMAR